MLRECDGSGAIALATQLLAPYAVNICESWRCMILSLLAQFIHGVPHCSHQLAWLRHRSDNRHSAKHIVSAFVPA